MTYSSSLLSPDPFTRTVLRIGDRGGVVSVEVMSKLIDELS